MKKYVIILLWVCSLFSSYCWAQEFKNPNGNPVKTDPPKREHRKGPENNQTIAERGNNESSLTTVVFNTTNDTCYLKINGKDHGQIVKGNPKSVKLGIGRYKLSFESAHTGETITPPDLNLSKDGGKNGDFTYPAVTFRNSLPETVTHRSEDLKPDTVSVTTGKTSKNDKSPETDNSQGTSTGYNVEVSKEQAIISEISSHMVAIPGGSFLMGIEGGAKDEAPHNVTISPLKFSKFEITQLQWENIMGYNNSRNTGCVHCPVENVSWEEVDSFISKINRISKKKFRLPTEAEWEYVAKLGIGKGIGNATEMKRIPKDYLDRIAWYINNSNGKTHPVGERLASDLGIYDLFGNVSEWCYDYYTANYEQDSPNNPQGSATGEKKLVRGGSFVDYEIDIRLQERAKEKPSVKRKDIGFRLVMETN